MALGYYPQDEEVGAVDWDNLPLTSDDFWEDGGQPTPHRGFDGITLVAIALVLFLLIQLLLDRTSDSKVVEEAVPAPAPIEQSEPAEENRPVEPLPPPPSPLDPTVIIGPYDDYVLTQGVHGMSYGHMAIDIAAGKGATVKSPISGQVSQLFVDGVGNPVLVIENEVYQVTLLHGNYEVSVGQEVKAGDRVGTEGNRGYTVDWAGRLCAGRDCGYHTHLNVFDKRIGSNVNPLNLIG